MTDELDPILRALAAAVCGMLLGAPYRHRPGGISTHVLVALGACVYCTIAQRVEADDTLRVVQGVAQGVGFIGAAAVIKTRKYVVGITTAASIWIAGGLGCLTVFHEPGRAIAFAAAVSMLNALVREVERRVIGRSHRVDVITGAEPTP